MVRRVLLTLAAACCALLLIAVPPAAAQQYPPQEGSLQTNRSEVRPGDPVTVSGGGFASGSTVTVRFDDRVLGSTTARADGTFSLTVTIPSDASPGDHTLAATGQAPNGAERRLTTTINVLAASTTATTAAPQAAGDTLPRTGTEPLPMAAGGAVLIALGAMAVIATRRRRQVAA